MADDMDRLNEDDTRLGSEPTLESTEIGADDLAPTEPISSGQAFGEQMPTADFGSPDSLDSTPLDADKDDALADKELMSDDQ